jgi:hypothetical protein
LIMNRSDFLKRASSSGTGISNVTFCDEVKRCDHSVSTPQGYCISQRLTVESHAIGYLKCYCVKNQRWHK